MLNGATADPRVQLMISWAGGFTPFSKLAKPRSLPPVGAVAAPLMARRNPVYPVKLTPGKPCNAKSVV